jgi:hypothetical protein
VTEPPTRRAIPFVEAEPSLDAADPPRSRAGVRLGFAPEDCHPGSGFGDRRVVAEDPSRTVPTRTGHGEEQVGVDDGAQAVPVVLGAVQGDVSERGVGIEGEHLHARHLHGDRST